MNELAGSTAPIQHLTNLVAGCQGSGELIGLSSAQLIHRVGSGRTRKVEAGALRPQLG